MLITALLLLVLTAVIDKLIGIPDPWRHLLYIVLVLLIIVGMVLTLMPGLGRDLGLG